PYEARAGLSYAKTLGYVPADKTAEAASSTLEDAYDDYAVAQIAKALGKQSDYEFFMNRSHNYELLFNTKTGFMQARNSDGSWADPGVGWTEGDTWVYTWSPLHDVPGLMKLMGSPLFQKVALSLPGGKTFVITAHGNSPQSLYIQSAKLNGKPLTIPMLHFEDIQHGGNLEFEMGQTPSKWASDWHPAPLPRFQNRPQ